MAITKQPMISPTLDEGEWDLDRLAAVDAATVQCAILLESYINKPLRGNTLIEMEATIKPMFIYCINHPCWGLENLLDPKVQYINVSVSEEDPTKVVLSPSPQLVAWMGRKKYLINTIRK